MHILGKTLTPLQNVPLYGPNGQALTTSLATVSNTQLLLRSQDWPGLGTPYYRACCNFGNGVYPGDVVEFDLIDGHTAGVVIGTTSPFPTTSVQSFNTVADSSGNARTGTLFPVATPANQPTIATSPVSGFSDAISFPALGSGLNGTSLIDCGGVGLGVNTQFTVEGWFKRNVLGTTQMLVGKWHGTGTASNNNFVIYFTTGNILSFQVLSGTPAVISGASGSAITDTASAHAFALTWDASNVRLLVDGTVAATTAMTTIQTPDTVTPFRIGGDYDSGAGGPFPFSGIIDEVRLSNTCRYTTTYTPSTTPFTTDGNTLGLWHLDSIAAGGPTAVPDTTAGYVARSAWTTIPDQSANQTVLLQVRNQTSARGTLLSSWVEIGYYA